MLTVRVMRHPTLDDLFSRRGAVTKVARALDISTAAVSKWRVVPPRRVGLVAEALGVPADSLPTREARRPVEARNAPQAEAA